MSIFLAAMLLAGQPAIATESTAPAAHKQKPKQVCEYMEITGSRARQRVCRDAEGNLNLPAGVSDNAFGKANLSQSGTGSSMSSVPQ
jgi:hypothetical protein